MMCWESGMMTEEVARESVSISWVHGEVSLLLGLLYGVERNSQQNSLCYTQLRVPIQEVSMLVFTKVFTKESFLEARKGPALDSSG